MSIQYEEREPWLGFGLGLGSIGFCYPNSATMGTAYDRRLSCYYGCLVEGGFVLDKREPLLQDHSLAFKSPMHCASLDASGEVDYFADSPASKSWLVDAIANDPNTGEFGALARYAKANPGGFDRVPTIVYLAWWRERGARVGFRKGDTIVWDDGTVEEIRPVEERWMVNGEIVRV